MCSNSITYFTKRAVIGGSVLLGFGLLLSIIFLLDAEPARAQTGYIFDQEICTYPAGNLTYITHTDFYSNDARIYTGTSQLYAECILNGLISNTTYLLYTWVVSDPTYGAMRYAVDNQYLDTLDFPSLPTGWASVGTIVVSAVDVDPPVLTIDRADTGSGALVVDAVRLVGIQTATDQANTVVYTLPTTGDVVMYERSVTSGDLMIAAPLWALVILSVFREVWKVARGE